MANGVAARVETVAEERAVAGWQSAREWEEWPGLEWEAQAIRRKRTPLISILEGARVGVADLGQRALSFGKEERPERFSGGSALGFEKHLRKQERIDSGSDEALGFRVADETGVSKGGLLHHFPSKRSLLDGLFAELLEEFSGKLAGLMDQDPKADGRFTRAYVSVVLEQVEQPETPSLWALGVCILTDPVLRDRWKDWYEDQLGAHQETDGSTGCRVARCAADGIWLARFLGTQGGDPAALRGYLMEDQLLAGHPRS